MADQTGLKKPADQERCSPNEFFGTPPVSSARVLGDWALLKVISELMSQHDYRLVAVAGAVCFCASVTAFRLYSRMQGAKGLVRGAWLLLTAMVAGSGVWASHFVAMVAYHPGVKAGYSPIAAMASLMLAVLFVGAGFAAAPSQKGRSSVIAGGMLVGVGLALMHYMGMAAFVAQGRIVWEQATVAASILLGAAGATAALMAAGRARSLKSQLIAGAVMTLGVFCLHFTGMAAISIHPDPTVAVSDELLTAGMLTFAVATIAGLIILGGLGAVLIESQTSRSALERIRRLANAAYEGIVVVQNGRINDCNAAFCDLAGAALEDLLGRPLMGHILTLDDGAPLREGDARREGLLQPVSDGPGVPVEVFARLMDDGARVETSGLTVLAIRDLRERRSAEEKIRYLAEHDGLTGLPNRNSLQARLAGALERVEASGESLAVICIDLDHFKEANDLHGHVAGDALLVEAARRLQAATPAPWFAARLGGDEFVVVQVAGGDQPAAAAELAGALLEALSEPLMYEGQTVSMNASLGVSLWPDDGRTGEALLANADMALYRAKESGRGVYRFFKREMDETIRERRNMARELRKAILEDELVVYYQPLARASDGEVCGFEALCRWQHPVRGMVPPIDFIPLAEESGLIGALGEWVLRRACADAAAWEKPLRIAVNLSPLQLNQPSLPALVQEVLITTGLSPSRLELEVTESALFKDYQRALDNLRRLKALGVRIAMDDFGTGFSSLSTLQSFPFDKIKIDKSFVEQINQHDRATVIVKAVLGLGRSLEIPVVAEGVETTAQLDFLKAENCAEVQGYHIGRPAPLAAVEGWTSLNGGAPAAGGSTAQAAKPRRVRKAA
jgi:diguanylate cyclase (GGDEF)-like protein/PAS domain S-box-containing protein